MFGTPLPSKHEDAVRDIAFPVDPPEENEREIPFKGYDITMRREADTIEFEVPHNEDVDDPTDTAEHQLRQAFGLDAQTKEKEGRRTVFGFNTLVPGDGTRPPSKDTTLMRIERPPLIAEIV
jgi:hypothetical protein